jgi:hypothetical protein
MLYDDMYLHDRIYEAWGWATHGRLEVWVAARPSFADGRYPKAVSMATAHKYERKYNIAFRTPERHKYYYFICFMGYTSSKVTTCLHCQNAGCVPSYL